MSTTPKNYDQILGRVNAFREKVAKEASHTSQLGNPKGDSEAVHGIKDPNDEGTVTPPDHPDGDSNDKKNLPKSSENDSHEGQDLTDKDTNPSGTGKNVPGPTADGDRKDEAANSPTAELSKIAGAVGSIVDRIKVLREGEAKGGDKKEAAKKVEPEVVPEVVPEVELSVDLMQKLAKQILETEEGVAYATEILKKSAGEEAALELIKGATEQHRAYTQLEKQAAEQAAWQTEREEHELGCIEEAFNNATPEQRHVMEKTAAAHGACLDTYGEEDWLKYAYAGGADDAAGMMGDMGPDQMAEGGGDPTIPGGGEELGDEEILALIVELVESGQLPPEVAEQVMMELQGGGGEGEELPPEGALPEEALPEEAMMGAPLPEGAPPEAKMATALADKLLASKK